MKKTLYYSTNEQYWKASNLLIKAGYRRIAEAYWVQVFRKESCEIIIIREPEENTENFINEILEIINDDSD